MSQNPSLPLQQQTPPPQQIEWATATSTSQWPMNPANLAAHYGHPQFCPPQALPQQPLYQPAILQISPPVVQSTQPQLDPTSTPTCVYPAAFPPQSQPPSLPACTPQEVPQHRLLQQVISQGEAGSNTNSDSEEVAGSKNKRRRGPNWSEEEELALVDAYREHYYPFIEDAKTAGIKQVTKPAKEKWEAVAACVENRTADECERSWSNMNSDFRKISDFGKRTGQSDYFSLTPKDKSQHVKNGIIPRSFHQAVFDSMHRFLGERANVKAPYVQDSGRGLAPSAIANAGVEEDAGEDPEMARWREENPEMNGVPVRDGPPGLVAASTGKKRKRGTKAEDDSKVAETMVQLQREQLSVLTTMIEERRELARDALKLEQERLKQEKESSANMSTSIGTLANVFAQYLQHQMSKDP